MGADLFSHLPDTAEVPTVHRSGAVDKVRRQTDNMAFLYRLLNPLHGD
jgi:hypothetical protein